MSSSRVRRWMLWPVHSSMFVKASIRCMWTSRVLRSPPLGPGPHRSQLRSNISQYPPYVVSAQYFFTRSNTFSAYSCPRGSPVAMVYSLSPYMAEAQAVQDLLVDGDFALAVEHPVEPAVLLVPGLIEHEVHAVPGELGAFAAAKAGPVRRRHRKDEPHLPQHRLLVGPGVLAVLVEMRDESAVLVVLGAVQPERQQLRGQMTPAFVQTHRDLFLIHSHSQSSYSPWRNLRADARPKPVIITRAAERARPHRPRNGRPSRPR